jgi:protein-disulfide isomerase/uncharacterized membrane protein
MGLGLIISAYLLYRHNLLTGSSTSGKIDFCSTVFGKGCDGALTSDISSILGLPLASWGIMYYLTLLVFLFLSKMNAGALKRETDLVIILLSFLACLGSISLLVLMMVKPSLFCPFCTVIHVINLFLFYCLWRTMGYSMSLMLQHLKLSVKFQGTKKEKLSKWIGLATLVLVPFILFQGLYFIEDSYNKAKQKFNPEKYLASFYEKPTISVPVDADDPVLGDPKTPVELIVFSDFECPACHIFAQVMKVINRKYKGKYHIVFKHFPLGKACNPSVETDVHPRACEAALASEAAKQQGKFWAFHDSLFITVLAEGEKTLCSIASEIGLDHQQFEENRLGEKARQKVKQTIDEAIKLGINATPTVYLNGRMVDDIRLQPMDILMADQLRKLQPSFSDSTKTKIVTN